MDTLRLSNRQYAMLKTFAAQSTRYHFNEEEAGAFNQTTFRSMLVRKWIGWDGQGFFMTKLGREAVSVFDHGEILRKLPSLSLTTYFNPKNFSKSNVRVLRKTA